jgi:tetratricopeptide (TPR) repeat protein
MVKAAAGLAARSGNVALQRKALTYEAALHGDLGDAPTAIESAAGAIIQARDLGETSSEAALWGNLGAMLSQLGDWRGGLRASERALELNPTSGSALVNAAEACLELGNVVKWLRYARNDAIKEKPVHGDEIVYCSAGDGTTSEGEWWEALNSASNLRLPVLFLIEDNKYAISVPIEVQTAGGSVSKLVSNFPNLLVEEVDGNDPILSYQALLRAAEWCRQRKGPAIVHAHVTRPYSHSLSDDEILYKPPREREEEAKRDPLATFPKRLLEEGVATESDIEAIKAQVEEDVQVAADMALVSPQPKPETATLWVYFGCGSTSEQFDTEDDPHFTGEPTTMVDLLNACMKDEMARDPGSSSSARTWPTSVASNT